MNWTAPLKLIAIDPLLLRPNVCYPLSGSSGGEDQGGCRRSLALMNPSLHQPFYVAHNRLVPLRPKKGKSMAHETDDVILLLRPRSFRVSFLVQTGHLRVPKTLTFKMRPSAQPFSWKWVLFAWEWKIISISKADHLTSFWFRGPGELGNGLFGPLLFKPWDYQI